MKILFLALTAATLAIVGCSTDQRVADTGVHKNGAYKDNGTNSYNAGAQDNANPAHYGPGGYSSVGPDGTGVPNPSVVNPLDPQSDNSLHKK